HALIMTAARYVAADKSRHSRLTGEPVDIERARARYRITPASTVAPGTEEQIDLERPTHSSQPATTSPWRRLWGRVSTTIQYSVTRVAWLGVRDVTALRGR